MKLDIKASLKHAALCVEQWEHHDRFRETEADKSLYEGECPDDIAAYKALLLLNAIHEQVPFFETVPTCPECCQEHPAYWTMESYKIDCECGCRFEVHRHMTSIPCEVME